MMESLLQSTQSYAQLLKRCRTEEVANWKPQDLERALHWTSYFKNVYEKTKGKASVRQRLDSHLNSLGVQMSISFGTKQLNFEFLAHGVDYLVKSLLENPVLSEELLHLLLKEHQYQHIVSKGEVELHSLVQWLCRHLQELSQSKLLLTSLMNTHTRLHQESKLPSPSETPVYYYTPRGEVLTNAVCLMESLKNLASTSTAAELESVEGRLSQVAQLQDGLESIMVCLSWDTETHRQSDQQLQPAHEGMQPRILQWLIKRCGSPCVEDAPSLDVVGGTTAKNHAPHNPLHLPHIWRLPPHLLASVSQQHSQFFKLYLEHLMYCASQIEALANESSRHYDELLCRFRHLCACGGAMKETCLSEVRSRLPMFISAEFQSFWSKLYVDLRQ